MRLHLFSLLLKWTLSLAALAGLLAGAYLVQERARRQREAQAAADTAAPPKRAANKVIKLGAQFAESHGLKDEPAQSVRWEKRAAAYGRVVPNPRATAEVRVAFAGTLRAVPDGAWPALGMRVKAGQVMAHLDVRVGPQERLDLLTKLNEARLKQQGAEEHVRLQQARVDRFKGAGQAISRAELDTARSQLTEARTQLATATAAVKEWQQALDAINRLGDRKDRKWSQPLTAPAGGEITELAGRPGMALEPGGVVARVVDFRFALVRLELPPECLTAAPPAEVELFALSATPAALEGASNRPDPSPPVRALTGRLLGTAGQVEVHSQFAAFWYEVDTGPPSTPSTTATKATGEVAAARLWRPGLFVKAFVPVPHSEPRPAVSVPETSLLYHDGRALVYVRLSPGRYERREVQVLGRQRGAWVLARGVEAGEPVVSRRAQVLLSEEFRAEVDND
jgi:hypothetical protein